MSEPQQQPKRVKPKYRSGAGADHVGPSDTPAPHKFIKNQKVFYTKDGTPGVAIKTGDTDPEVKPGGAGFRYPVVTTDGQPFVHRGALITIVDEIYLRSEAEHENEQQKQSEERRKAEKGKEKRWFW